MAQSFYGRTGIEIRDTLTYGLQDLSQGIRPILREAVQAGAELVRTRAHDLANVSPGAKGNARDGTHMRDDIDIRITDRTTSVIADIYIDLSNVPYAVHQEFGPHGKPFMRPAIDESRSEVHGVMQQIIKDNAANGFKLSTQVQFRRFA